MQAGDGRVALRARLAQRFSHARESACARVGLAVGGADAAGASSSPGPRLTPGRLNRTPLVVERRHDARREQRRAAAPDQLDQRVQVNRAFVRELLGHGGVETGFAQPGAPPRDRVVGSSGRRRPSAGS